MVQTLQLLDLLGRKVRRDLLDKQEPRDQVVPQGLKVILDL